MSVTPLYTAVSQFAGTKPSRFHMPGHKGYPIKGLENITAIDWTELPSTGNLYEGGDVIEQAEALWADAWSMQACQFLTGGSTQGLHTAFFAACTPGEEVLIDRASHRSIHNAMALLDLQPHYLIRSIGQVVRAQQVEEKLKKHPKVKTVCITSPTYYGILSDVSEIARVVHNHGGTLIVDGAHGCHLPFLGQNPFAGADLVVSSAHKTLPALGQAAVIFSGGRFGAAELRAAASVTGTSSPSYPILASLDLCRAWMEEDGLAAYGRVWEQVARLRVKFPSLKGQGLDPARLTILARDGFALKKRLEEKNVFPEMADAGHVVFICTCCDKEIDFTNLTRALEDLAPFGPSEGEAPGAVPVPIPEIALSPRKARFSPHRQIVLREAEDAISAVQVAPYPPGVPVIAPGERITKKHLAYLAQIGYNIDNRIEVIS